LKDRFAILRRELREGRLRVRREDRVQRCEGMKEENGYKKVDQFVEIHICEIEPCI